MRCRLTTGRKRCICGMCTCCDIVRNCLLYHYIRATKLRSHVLLFVASLRNSKAGARSPPLIQRALVYYRSMAPKKKGNSVAQPFVAADDGLQAIVLLDEEDDCQLAPLTLDTPKVRFSARTVF